MPKDEARRSALIERLTDHVLACGLRSASLRPLAKAAGTSDRMLLYYFADKAELLGTVLESVAARMTAALAQHIAPELLPLAELEARLVTVLLDDQFWPYMALWLEIASLSARGDPLMRDIGNRIGQGFLMWGAMQLDSAAEHRVNDALRLMIGIEGRVLLRSIGMGEEPR